VANHTPLGIRDRRPFFRSASSLRELDHNRFRALDAKNGKEVWVTRLERRGNADPITYQGRNGKQYVAVVATDTVMVYALP
jgi:glucose dehydrogenase